MAAIVTLTHDNKIQIIRDLNEEQAKELFDILTCAEEFAKWQSDINDANAMYIILCNIYKDQPFKRNFKGRNGTHYSVLHRYRNPFTGTDWFDGVISDTQPKGDFKLVEIIS